jgi:hypothetical protein
MLRGDLSVGSMPAKKLKAFMATYFLSSPFSAVLNLTSNVMNTPALILHLTKSEKETASIMARAFKEATNAINWKTLEIDLSKVKDDRIAFYLKTSMKEGKLAPAETISLAIAAMDGNPALMSIGKGFKGLFAKTEAYNRAVAAIAGGLAHDFAKKDMQTLTKTYEQSGLRFGDRADADFINHVIDSTQMIMNSANVAPIARTSISVLYTFKSYPLGVLALMKSLPAKERMVMLGTLMVMSGVNGLPFSEDLTDLVESISGMLGHPIQVKRAARKALEDTVGKDIAYVVEYGLFGKAIGQHVGPRMGMSNIIPGTKVLDRYNPNSVENAIMEVAGPAGGLTKTFVNATKKIADGKVVSGLTDMSPAMIGNVAKAIEAYKNGYFVDSKGNKTADADALSIVLKGLGVNSLEAGLLSQVRGDIKRIDQITQYTSNSFAEALARARKESDNLDFKKNNNPLTPKTPNSGFNKGIETKESDS